MCKATDQRDFFAVNEPSAVPWGDVLCFEVKCFDVLMSVAGSGDVVVTSFDAMWWLVLCHVAWCNAMSWWWAVVCCALQWDGMLWALQGHVVSFEVVLWRCGDPSYYSVLKSKTLSVLQSTTSVLLCTTKYNSCTTPCYKVLLLYYPVLQSTTPVLLCTKYYSGTTNYYSSTTLYYKVLLQYYKVLLQYYSGTTLYYKVLLQYYAGTTLYYKVLLQYYSVLQSTTPVLKSSTPVLLCTTKYYSSTAKYYSGTTWPRHFQCAEQQESPSNFTKYCACHEIFKPKISGESLLAGFSCVTSWPHVWSMYRSSPFRSTLNTGYITGLDMCEVCTEAVHSVALRTRFTSQVWTCVKYVPKQSIP